ncbi:MAG: TIGR03560 family F420-dependent LLM class oxidoreductase, partial [Acidimicrobiia bacterium]|nr:TIGR03560 family F420-dependent LLM class oxidoreductase [Acidimicrobiia bacterium]
SDELRGRVGIDEDDQAASEDAFELLDTIVGKRLARGLVTVVDTLGLNPEQRAGHRQLAADHDIPCYAIGFDTPGKVCRERNKARTRPIPARVLTGQIKRWEAVKAELPDEGFAGVFEPDEVDLVPASQLDAAGLAARQQSDPRSLAFGLQISSFSWDGDTADIAARLTEVAAAAESAGFTSLWVMDHFRQIPQVGPEWHDMLESYTTLAYLAGMTTRIRLGVLVTGVTYRNPAHLGKILATLDVLSNGRAVCGLGLGWFRAEHDAYGWEFPPVPDRYDLLEDTLQLLPVLWGPGSPSFEGRAIKVAEAMCYPRPIQDPIPIMVGGSGEKRTLRLVAQYADACNLFGDPATITHKVAVLEAHCLDLGRDPAEVEITTLSRLVIAEDRAALRSEINRLRPRSMSADEYAAVTNAGLAEDHIGRFREYAEAGVHTAIVNLTGAPDPGAVERFGEVIRAFR